MKQLFIFMLLSCACLCAKAQTDSVYVWNKWCARKDTLLLFNTGNNVIQVYCRGMKPADFKLKSLDRSLRIGTPEIKGDTVSVMAMPYVQKDKRMRLAITNSKTGKVIKTVNFTSDDIPMPMARLGNIQAPEALRKDIQNQNALRVYFPKSLYNYPYRITQYTFKIHYDKGGATVNANGFLMTNEALQQISAAPVGTVIEFTGIKATCPDCAVRSLEDFKLKIK